MSTITFDTLEIKRRLRDAGFDEIQIERILDELIVQIDIYPNEFTDHSIDNTLATHADIDRIERKLLEHDGGLRLTRWMLGIIVGGVIMITLKLYFPM